PSLLAASAARPSGHSLRECSLWLPAFAVPRKRESILLCWGRSKWIPARGYAASGMTVLFLAAFGAAFSTAAFASDEEHAVERTYVSAPAAPAFQTWDAAQKKSAGCVSCHTQSDRKTMHATEAVVLGCTDCHGGDASVFATAEPGPGYSTGYVAARDK